MSGLYRIVSKFRNDFDYTIDIEWQNHVPERSRLVFKDRITNQEYTIVYPRNINSDELEEIFKCHYDNLHSSITKDRKTHESKEVLVSVLKGRTEQLKKRGEYEKLEYYGIF